MKKLTSVMALALCAVLLFGLAACGGNTGGGSAANYIDTIRNARDSELNAVMYIVADTTTNEGAVTESGGIELTEEQQAIQNEFIFNEATGFSADEMESYAISLGFSITQAYGVAIVLPKEGQEQVVTDMMNAYVLSQQKAQENYLPDQYAIALAAVVKTVNTGEVLMAMCENQDVVMAAMEATLAA